MKTVRKGKEIKRVGDEEAKGLVKSKGFKYIPKHEWRTQVRDAKPVESQKKATKKIVQTLEKKVKKNKNERKRKTRA